MASIEEGINNMILIRIKTLIKNSFLNPKLLFIIIKITIYY